MATKYESRVGPGTQGRQFSWFSWFVTSAQVPCIISSNWRSKLTNMLQWTAEIGASFRVQFVEWWQDMKTHLACNINLPRQTDPGAIIYQLSTLCTRSHCVVAKKKNWCSFSFSVFGFRFLHLCIIRLPLYEMLFRIESLCGNGVSDTVCGARPCWALHDSARPWFGRFPRQERRELSVFARCPIVRGGGGAKGPSS